MRRVRKGRYSCTISARVFPELNEVEYGFNVRKQKIRRQKGNGWNASVISSPDPQGPRTFEWKYFGLGFLRMEVHIRKSLGALLYIKRHLPLFVNFI